MFSSKIIRYFIYAIILITIIFFITIYRVKKQKGKKLRQFFSILLATILIIGILTAYCYAKSRLLSTQIVESFYWEENVTITNKTDNSLKTIFLADTNHTINISDFDIKKNEEVVSIVQRVYVICSNGQKYLCTYPIWKQLEIGDSIIVNYDTSNPPTIELPSNKT